MKRISILIILLFNFSFLVTGHKVVTGVSETKYVNITKDPPKPPYLEIEDGSLIFGDNDGDNKIDAKETTNIRFLLKNLLFVEYVCSNILFPLVAHIPSSYRKLAINQVLKIINPFFLFR